MQVYCIPIAVQQDTEKIGEVLLYPKQVEVHIFSELRVAQWQIKSIQYTMSNFTLLYKMILTCTLLLGMKFSVWPFSWLHDIFDIH